MTDLSRERVVPNPLPEFHGPWRTLDPERVREIRAARATGTTARALARRFGVSVRTVYRYLATPRPSVLDERLRILLESYPGYIDDRQALAAHLGVGFRR